MKTATALIVGYLGVSLTATAAPLKEIHLMNNSVRRACEVDLKRFCGQLTPGDARAFLCLKAYDDQISKACSEAWAKRINKLSRMVFDDDDDEDNGSERNNYCSEDNSDGASPAGITPSWESKLPPLIIPFSGADTSSLGGIIVNG